VAKHVITSATAKAAALAAARLEDFTTYLSGPSAEYLAVVLAANGGVHDLARWEEASEEVMAERRQVLAALKTRLEALSTANGARRV